MMNGKIISAMLGLALAGMSAGAAAAPTLISNASAFSGPCYNFNNYIPSTDTPVIGGAVTATKDIYSDGGTIVTIYRGFGNVCSPVALVLAPHTSLMGYLAYYTQVYGVQNEWFRVPNTKVTCPFNSAPIKVSGYTRTDGGLVVPNVIPYDFNIGSLSAASPHTFGATMELTLCVKTDTTP